jgi:hypothetical protein
VQLTTAKNTLILVREVKKGGEEATFESRILLQIIRAVRTEMHRRKELKPRDRAREEEKPCSLYNDLREKLSPEIQKKAPEPLRKEAYFFSGAYYPENLRIPMGRHLPRASRSLRYLHLGWYSLLPM